MTDALVTFLAKYEKSAQEEKSFIWLMVGGVYHGGEVIPKGD